MTLGAVVSEMGANRGLILSNFTRRDFDDERFGGVLRTAVPCCLDTD
jgi:hypothetical protein